MTQNKEIGSWNKINVLKETQVYIKGNVFKWSIIRTVREGKDYLTNASIIFKSVI